MTDTIYSPGDSPRNLDVWHRVLVDDYGLNAQLVPLDGEYDLNIRVDVEGEARAVLKVMRPDCNPDFIDMQCRAMAHLADQVPDLPLPRVIPTRDGALFQTRLDEEGATRLVWLISMLEGNCYADVKPQTGDLLQQLGGCVAGLCVGLQTFKHEALHRDFKWNLPQSGWISEHLHLINEPDKQALLAEIVERFQSILVPALSKLPDMPIHNDVNDYNVLVHRADFKAPRVSGLIDFGDMVAAPAICDLAIAGAYAVLGQENPVAALSAMVRGYHARRPLSETELDLLYPLILTRLAVSVVNSAMMKRERPDDPYVVISEKPAWDFLDRSKSLHAGQVRAALRVACGLPAVAAEPGIMSWLESKRDGFAPILGIDLTGRPMVSLAVSDCAIPRDPTRLTDAEAGHLIEPESLTACPVQIGYFAEPRLIYTEPAFRLTDHESGDRRTIHLGIDVFSPAGTPVCAPLDGTVFHAEDRSGRLDYGGVVILEHRTEDGDLFYTLYGHLNAEVATRLSKGDPVSQGEQFAELGDQSTNGGWDPHIHFQMALTVEGMDEDWPGVCLADEIDLWTGLCPNPAVLLNLPGEQCRHQPLEKSTTLLARQSRFGANLSLSYSDPCQFVRGWKSHLYDEMGRPYLDAYNNVPHVGHAHPRIQALAARQLTMINTNTRYLHPAQIEFAEALLAKMPAKFSRVYFVNSGSEANELSMRLARAYTGGKGMIVQDHGYHGNTTGAIDISPYKFNGKGGSGAPDWVEICSVADPYRGPFGYDDPKAGAKYAGDVDRTLGALQEKGIKLAGFIAESFPSVGGQIIPPDGYLANVYQKIRAAGGLCIADEVQTGLGRLGRYYWGFEQQGVEPDMVVLGKPIGNGHPIGAVVTTDAIADAFANGMEFFSTFGGSTLSCQIGREVLQIVDDEALAENAERVGQRLLEGYRSLMARHPSIGDVRGLGLFTGIEMVSDRAAKTPSKPAAKYVADRLRAHRILIGTDGPFDNVLKIRPPLPFNEADCDLLIDVLDKLLTEVDSQV